VKDAHSCSVNNVNVAGSVLMVIRMMMIMMSLRVRLPKQPRKYIVVALNARSEHGELYKETLAFMTRDTNLMMHGHTYIKFGFHVNSTGKDH